MCKASAGNALAHKHHLETSGERLSLSNFFQSQLHYSIQLEHRRPQASAARNLPKQPATPPVRDDFHLSENRNCPYSFHNLENKYSSALLVSIHYNKFSVVFTQFTHKLIITNLVIKQFRLWVDGGQFTKMLGRVTKTGDKLWYVDGPSSPSSLKIQRIWRYAWFDSGRKGCTEEPTTTKSIMRW